jgi:hypothetical protein
VEGLNGEGERAIRRNSKAGARRRDLVSSWFCQYTNLCKMMEWSGVREDGLYNHHNITNHKFVYVSSMSPYANEPKHIYY